MLLPRGQMSCTWSNTSLVCRHLWRHTSRSDHVLQFGKYIRVSSSTRGLWKLSRAQTEYDSWDATLSLHGQRCAQFATPCDFIQFGVSIRVVVNSSVEEADFGPEHVNDVVESGTSKHIHYIQYIYIYKALYYYITNHSMANELICVCLP
jgi:hypothetical protein